MGPEQLVGPIEQVEVHDWRVRRVPAECQRGEGRGARGEALLVPVRHPASGIRHPVSGIRYPVSGIRYPASGIRHPASGIRHPAPSCSVFLSETLPIAFAGVNRVCYPALAAPHLLRPWSRLSGHRHRRGLPAAHPHHRTAAPQRLPSRPLLGSPALLADQPQAVRTIHLRLRIREGDPDAHQGGRRHCDEPRFHLHDRLGAPHPVARGVVAAIWVWAAWFVLHFPTAPRSG